MEMELQHLAVVWPSILRLIFLFSLTKTWFLPAAICLTPLGNETDRIALLEFKAMISDNPDGVLSSWNDSADFCRWEGVTCGSKHKRVTSLDLQGMSLMGSLSPYISNLTFLRSLNLANNKFHGEIPRQVGYLFRLRYLNLTVNTFEGQIPANISSCSNLIILDLRRNNLTGEIPAELGFNKKLEVLNLSFNKLTGAIPLSLGNLSSLRIFSLLENNLQGTIPYDLGQLTSLTYFQVSVNNLTGTIPSTLYNFSSVTHFLVTANQLKGSLPPSIGVTLSNLQEFGIGENQIHGSFPISFTNASNLRVLEISSNEITGQVPDSLGYNLKSLRWLNMEYNFLGNNTSRDLDFVTSLSNCSNLKFLILSVNHFGGQLPGTIANMSNLVDLRVSENQIYGSIPLELGNLVNLYMLHMSSNLFSGPIPEAFGKLVKLQVLALYGNQLSGEIPKSLCNTTRLTELYLDENQLEGNITSIGNCKNLQYLRISANNLIGSIPQQIIGLFPLIILDLSQNAFTGPIPLDVGSLTNIYALDMSENKLSGEIPFTIGKCLSLEFFYMAGNMLQGDIPSSFASLGGLQELDLSRNNLTGKISKELENLIFLKNLNLSFNTFEGEVPKKGVFSNVSEFSLDGNSNLCGGIPELKLPECPLQGKKRRMSTKSIILLVIIVPVAIFTAITSFYVSCQRKLKKNPSSRVLDVDKLPRISYNELLLATGNFSSDNIIGEGSFGLVYKGSLDSQGGRLIAVKVLKLQQDGASKSFLSECKALRNIRHRNLVKILTYCSSIDFKGNDFKALVFDFMENGSLEMWLHPKEDSSGQLRKLSLVQRLQVAIDVSTALHYLHDNCETPIIHCDLKPSNILFDSNMTARISDFGLARLLSNPINSSSRSETSSIGMKGTIGYLAPEYGVGSPTTKYADIYSFGIILLEIFTGRRPTDEAFTGDLTLHNFVKAKLPGQVMQVVDPILITTGDVGLPTTSGVMEDDVSEIQEDEANLENLRQDGGDVHKCIVSILEIGLACSADLPGDRMNMGDVSRKLNLITEAFQCTRIHQGKHVGATDLSSHSQLKGKIVL